MKRKTRTGLLLALMGGLAIVSGGMLAAQDPGSAPVQVSGACQESKTIFMDASRFGRKNSAAKNMTESHARHQASGWRFMDMEVYIENGDLEGFFITYSRTVACG